MLLKKKSPSGRTKLESRVLPSYSVAEQDEALLPRVTPNDATEATGQGVLSPKNTTPRGVRRSGFPLCDVDPAVPVCRSGPVQNERSGTSGPPTLEQTLTLRETSAEGDCLFDSIRRALLMRQGCCDL